MVTPSSFRLTFSEFASTATYPDAMINAWLAVAVQLVNVGRWGDLTDFGVSLFVAHRLVLTASNVEAAAAGLAPGQFSGILTSKSAEGVSASYDASKIAMEGDGHYNLTKYGLQYKELVRMLGAGPVQVNTGDDTSVSGYPWAGVVY